MALWGVIGRLLRLSRYLGSRSAGRIVGSVALVGALSVVGTAYPRGDLTAPSLERAHAGKMTGAAAPSPRADLGVSAFDSRDPTLVGGVLTYRVVVANLGPQRATRVKVLASITGAAEVGAMRVSVGGSCAVSRPGRVVCSIPALGSKRKATITITVRPAELGTVSLAATVSSSILDRKQRNNRAAQNTRVVGLDIVQGRGSRSTAADAGYPTVTTEIDASRDPTTAAVSGDFFCSVRRDQREPRTRQRPSWTNQLPERAWQQGHSRRRDRFIEQWRLPRRQRGEADVYRQRRPRHWA